jgi:hypothetical protein
MGIVPSITERSLTSLCLEVLRSCEAFRVFQVALPRGQAAGAWSAGVACGEVGDSGGQAARGAISTCRRHRVGFKGHDRRTRVLGAAAHWLCSGSLVGVDSGRDLDRDRRGFCIGADSDPPAREGSSGGQNSKVGEAGSRFRVVRYAGRETSREPAVGAMIRPVSPARRYEE